MGKAKKADSMLCSYFSRREGKSGVQISFLFFSLPAFLHFLLSLPLRLSRPLVLF